MARWLIALAFLLVLGLPMAMSRCTRESRAPTDAGLPALIIVTPHVPQIREEFARAFDEWRRREHGEGARLDFRSIGGTSEIIRALQARYNAALAAGKYTLSDTGEVIMEPGSIDVDVMFGGGTFDHGRLKTGVTLRIDDGRAPPRDVAVPMSVPAGFEQPRLDAWFGDNSIGAGTLYDPDQHWIGTALSGFGIVYNRDLTRELLGRDDLASFEDLADPRLAGWVALADPRQSGSVTTTIDAILSAYGWDRGWRVLRAISGNTRYFTNSSSKAPIDVSQGEAAAGLAIDFYGRTQSQVVMREGETPETARVGYVDPPGEVSIDADPVSILRAGPNPELARQFVEFCLSDEGQALWGFHATSTETGAGNPPDASGALLGPRRFELRRMPIRRDFYARFAAHLIDKVDPYQIVSDAAPAGWRSAIGIMMGAFAVDTHDDIGEAWRALRDARTRALPAPLIAEAETLFYAFPGTEQLDRHWAELFGDAEPRLPSDAKLPFTPENYGAIRAVWREPAVQSRLAIVYSRCFAENYRRITELLRNPVAPAAAAPAHAD
ncbi:MAG TPA: extracellular solute-binding protein [Phycisphaerales bacterium]|nr:extracellular solute-binding protein [Phycisphaerales bacterium]